MENNWAAEHLQVIRTLMERSALYRRALAPIMLVSGAAGTIGAVAGGFLHAESTKAFVIFWMAVGVLTLGAALLLVRRQSLKDAEVFWSLPTQRVAGGLFPCFLTGLGLGIAAVLHPGMWPPWLLACLWTLNYGCALRAAGFFVERGIKLFGAAFLAGGLVLLLASPYSPWLREPLTGHLVMGAFFGLLQLTYGSYLYFTERRPAS